MLAEDVPEPWSKKHTERKQSISSDSEEEEEESDDEGGVALGSEGDVESEGEEEEGGDKWNKQRGHHLGQGRRPASTTGKIPPACESHGITWDSHIWDQCD